MQNIKNHKLYKLALQFVKFGLIGVLNTAISLGVYYLFLFINPELYLIGNAVGFVVTVFISFYLNNKFVFGKEEKKRFSKNTLIKTYIAYSLTFLLGTGLIYGMVNFLGISKTLAPVINICITTPINFIMNKFWVHRSGANA